MKLVLLRFALMALGCAAACEAAGSARLIGPFIASIGVICAAVTAPQRALTGKAAVIAYAVCVPLGLLAHAVPAQGPLVAVAAAAAGFALLHTLKRPHAPALALVAMLALTGAPGRDLGAVLGMVAALWVGSRVGRCAAKQHSP